MINKCLGLVLRMRPRYYWLSCYLLINIVYFGLVEISGKLYGECQGVNLRSDTPVLYIFLLLMLSYIALCGPVFNLLFKIRVDQNCVIKKFDCGGEKFGRLLLLFQGLFFIYFTWAGTHIAGSTERDTSVLSQFWVLVPVDVIFYVYYGVYRHSRMFKPNLLVWVASNLVRGWSGVLLTIIFFESCRLARSGRVSVKHLFWGALLVAVGYPFLYLFKIFIRFYSVKVDVGVDQFFLMLDGTDLSRLILLSLEQIFNRLQLISSPVALHVFAPELRDEFFRNGFYPFWLEGLHGLAIDRVFGNATMLSLGQAFANILDPLSVDVNWNANPSLVGWIIVFPFLWPLLVIYTLILCWLSVFLTKKLSASSEAMDMVWYSWLVLLIPGWFGAFFLFVYSILFVVIVKFAMKFFGVIFLRVANVRS